MNENIQFYAHIIDPKDKRVNYWTLLPAAKRITIEGFEDVIIFIHKGYNDADMWVVAEGMTGLKMGEGQTKKEAIADFLDRAGRNDIGRSMLARMKQHGISPWFKEYFKVAKGVKP